MVGTGGAGKAAGRPAADDVKRRKMMAEEAEEGAAEEEGGDEVKVEGWAAATDAVEREDEDEGGDGGDEDENENEKEEGEGMRDEMRVFPERRATSAPSPPPRSTRGRRDSCGWRRSRWPSR